MLALGDGGLLVLTPPAGGDPVNDTAFANHEIDPVGRGSSRAGAGIVQGITGRARVVNDGKIIKVQPGLGSRFAHGRLGGVGQSRRLGVNKGSLVVALQCVALFMDVVRCC